MTSIIALAGIAHNAFKIDDLYKPIGLKIA